MQELISKATALLEALPYIQRFSGQTFVVKYGGSFMDSPDPSIRNGVARDIVFLEAVEINPVVVHGGGKAITRAMEAAGLKAHFIQGQRVTDAATVEVVDQVLSREINPEVVKTLQSLGGVARGFAGTDIFTCKKLWLQDAAGNPVDIGFVGEVTAVNTEPLMDCIRQESPQSLVRRPAAKTGMSTTATPMSPRPWPPSPSKHVVWSSCRTSPV